MIAFRNYLRKHPESREEYIKIKKEAVEKSKGDGEIYKAHKCDFVVEITKKELRQKSAD